MEEKQHKSPLELLLTIATIIIAIATLIKIFGKSEEEKREEKAQKSREYTYKNGATFEDFQYKDWADALNSAIMEGATEDEETVYNIFEKLKTIGDINKLIEAFGTHRQMFTASWISLPQAITTYFSKSEIKKLNGIISANGINYSFE